MKEMLKRSKLYDLYFNLRYCNRYTFILKHLFDRDELNDLVIETTSFCNRKCSFCPKHSDKRAAQCMSGELFKKILDDLENIGYKGAISLSFYGEPLADKRIFGFIKEIKKRFKSSMVGFPTNADLLTPGIFKELLKLKIGYMVISQHDPEPSKNIEYVKKFISSEEWNKGSRKPKIIFKRVCSGSDFLTDRAKSLKIKTRFNQFYCNPNLMIIRADGTVNLCCNDYYNEVVFGNVNRESIEEIWNSPKFRKVRSMIRRGDFSLGICRRCRE